MSTPSLPDDDLEASLRSAFADRADEIHLADLDPDLPHGIRVSLDHDPDRQGRRGGTARARWVAIAAAVALVGAGIGLATRAGDGGSTTIATDPSVPTTGVPRSEVFASFPDGVDPAVGAPIFVTGVHACPDCTDDSDARVYPAAETAMAEALASLGGDVTPPMPTSLGLDSDTWDSFYSPLGEADPDVFGSAKDPNERGGVVVARPAPGGGWGVVAVTSQVIDMTGLVREGDRLSGQVRVPVGAPVRVVVSRAPLDGEAPTEQSAISDHDLVTSESSGLTESILSLLAEGDGIDVGDGPIVVRVEVGDAPGQVGEDGVGVAATAVVGIPGDDAADAVEPIDRGTATTTPEAVDPGTATTTPVSVDQVPMWTPDPDGQNSGPTEVAAEFVEVVLGEEPAWAGRPGGSSGAAIEEGQVDGSVAVAVPLASGAELRVTLAEVDGVWSVLQVGDDGVRVDTSDPGTSVGGITLGGDEESMLSIVIRSAAGEGWSVERGRLPDDPVSFEGAHAVVLAVLDGEDRVIAAQGNAVP